MTAENSLCIQLCDELPEMEREFGSCDGFDEDCIQPNTVESSLEPYMILAKLRFDMTFSRQRGSLPNCHLVIVRSKGGIWNGNRKWGAL